MIKRKKKKEVQCSTDEVSKTETLSLTREEIQEIVNQQLIMAGAKVDPNTTKGCGRPYPPHFDLVPYPKGYSVPRFKIFTGEGSKDMDPRQHISHFLVSCGNTTTTDALLLRQFRGPAFQWYASLENESISTWRQMEDAFQAKFATISDRISVADLVWQELSQIRENP